MSARIPLAVPDLRGREAEFVVKCIRDNWVSSAGPEVIAFEERIAALTHRRHAIAVVNGTAALQLAFMATGLKAGHGVIVPDWTFAAPANAAVHAGGVPVFVDVRVEDWALDPALVVETLADDRSKSIRAVVAVDPLGHSADFDPIREACRQAGVSLIEDAAGAIGGIYKGQPCGALGDVSVISFNGNKTVTAGGGGMVLTDDAVMAQFVRHISTQARSSREYFYDAVGFNYRMPNINAAIGLAQLDRLDEMIGAKQAIARRYDRATAGRHDILPMPRPKNSTSACWLYCVRLASEIDAIALIDAMENANIEARTFWRSLSAQVLWRDSPRRLSGVSASLSGTVVSLPCSSALTEQDQDRVVMVLSGWRGGLIAT